MRRHRPQYINMEVQRKPMKHLGLIQTAACGALLLAAFYPRTVVADEWDKKTDVHFGSDVRVPGMTLKAGDYVFKLLDSPSDRYIVQIFNKTEQHLYTTVLAIPNYKLKTPDKVKFTFYEVPGDQAQPIRTFWYPGDNYGREFVYRGAEAQMIANAARENVRSGENTYATAQNTQPTETTTAETTTEQTTATETQPAEPAATPIAPEPAPVVESAPPAPEEPTVEQEPAQEPTPAPAPTSSLPSTASEWPLAGLIGISSLAGALVVRAARKA